MASTRELMAIAYWPELVARKMMARAIRLAKDMPAMAAAGLEVNISGGDFCSSRGPSISPAAFHDIITPALKAIVDACHQDGMYYFFTSDGNFWPVAEDMFNVAGVDGWLETDKSAGMDMRKLRERFPDKVFVGNIRSQVLHRGTADEVVSEVMDCMEVAHDLGGVIVGVSNLIMTGTPPENIEALLRTIEDNR
jgi:uroporphyrinogen-III decarboxylase